MMNFIIVDDGDVTYHNPLGELLPEIETLLRNGKCFAPSFLGLNEYSVETYVVEKALARTEAVFLLDRNIYSQVISLAKGEPVDDASRYAAAIMAFAHCATANVEPNLAIYEGTASGAKGGWRRNLRLFRGADEIHPINCAALALGRSDRFTKKFPLIEADALSDDFDPRLQLRPYKFHYPVLLKIANLMRSSMSADDKMTEFLDWVYSDWLFSAPATVLASMALSKHPTATPLREARSSDRDKVLKNIRNATWDIVYVSEWFKRIKVQDERNELTVICSRDVALLNLASLFRRLVLETDEATLLRSAGFGKSVIKKFKSCMERLNDPGRKFKIDMPGWNTYRKHLVSRLESEILLPSFRG